METITQTTQQETYIDNFQKLDLSHLKRLNMSEEETEKINDKLIKQIKSGDLSCISSGEKIKEILKDCENKLFN